jgi:lipoprotein-anchoring transpeptidase ErfK/SrfK
MTFSPILLAALLAQAPSTPPAPAQTTKAAPQGKAAPARAADGLSLQVALDRAGFSPGPIDGQAGSSTKRALEAYRKQNGGDPQLGEPTTRYEINEADAAGPFEPQIPSELPDQAKLPALSYKSVVEMLSERFHSTPQFLQKLNPGAKFAAGEQITVPNVEPMQTPAPEAKAEPKAAEGKKPAPTAKPDAPRGTSGRGAPAAAAAPDVVVTVSKSSSALTVTDASGKVLMHAPVTTGSAHDPLPLGEWKVNGVSFNPPFRYNPELFWDADPSHDKALIKPGPNNPVGLVWIDLSKEHYGIHGTPEPSTVGKTQSHGCVRMTNWDAVKLAGMVKPGTKVVFAE